jgi:hypothetical protein
MAGQICPIFERETEEKIVLIGAWMQHPVNLKIVPDEANFLELGHIASMLSTFIRNEKCREVPNHETDVGRGCKFISGAFIMGAQHPAPNEPGGRPEKDCKYVMKQNDGVIILIRESKKTVSRSPESKSAKNELSLRKCWWQFWK